MNNPPAVPEKLDAESEGLISLGLEGGPFHAYAVRELMRWHKLSWNESRWYMLLSAFAREDTRCVRMFLSDWAWQDKQPQKSVHKFIPGEHYYAGDSKFDSLEEAKEHIRQLGYQYGGLEERHVYAREGD